MKAPLKLRSNARDADEGSGKLEPKRVQTVFDVICRVAEDSIGAAKEHDMYAAVLCFGLRHVTTCDLLAFLEHLTKTQELLDRAEGHEKAGMPYHELRALLAANGIYSAEAQTFHRPVPSNGQQLYTVYGHRPLIRLLSNAGAPYCKDYVEKHMTSESAGKYFMAFAVPSRSKDLEAVVASLPDACKYKTSSLAPKASRAGAGIGGGGLAAMAASSLIPGIGILGAIAIGIGSGMISQSASGQMIDAAEASGVEDATRFADKLLAGMGDTLAILKSIPTAVPKPLPSVVRLVKRLQSMLRASGGKEAATDEEQREQTSPYTFNTFINWERLLDDIEPYLYGGTPMCQALRSVVPLFEHQEYSLKVMMLVSDGDPTDGDPLPPAQAVRNASRTIFACLLTDSTIKEPRKLYSPEEADIGWPSPVRTMFNIASTVSCDSGAVQALRRRGWKLPLSGKCKLFIQADNPAIIDEFTAASRHLGTSSDALAEMLGQIALDNYIQTSNHDAKVTDQGPRSICWAHATGSVIHLASKRVVGRKVAEFITIRRDLLAFFGDNDDGQRVGNVLKQICPRYRLRYQECDEAGARAAIHARRPVVATFWLDGNHWNSFCTFYKSTPKGILSAREMSAPAGGRGGDDHAVVLVRCDESSLTFMNSWGPVFANNGFFAVDRSSTLKLLSGPRMRFYDVYWTTDDLSAEERGKWRDHKKETASNVIGFLPKSFHELPVVCPHCKRSAAANKYDGAWYEARCRTCLRTFKPTGSALL